jgi:8-oxo-dGTP pyrophosphatase MutT (NUDIX family)
LTRKRRRMIARGLLIKQVRNITYVLLVKKITEPDTYELPGGGRKQHEKWVAALIRELREELHISVSLSMCKKWGEGILRTSHDHTESIRVALYTVRHKGRLKAKNEILEYRWVALHELSNVPLERKTKIMLWLYFRFGTGSL